MNRRALIDVAASLSGVDLALAEIAAAVPYADGNEAFANLAERVRLASAPLEAAIPEIEAATDQPAGKLRMFLGPGRPSMEDDFTRCLWFGTASPSRYLRAVAEAECWRAARRYVTA